MKTRLMILFAVMAAAVLISGCRDEEQQGATTQVNPPAATAPAPLPAPVPAAREAPPQPSAGREEVVLTLTLPPLGEALTTESLSGHGPNCPQGQVSALLGAEIASPHGVVIGKVLPEGLGAKAGLQPGDSIVAADGQTVTCPSTLLPCLQRRSQPREVRLTVVRGQAKTEQSAPAESESPGKP